MLDPLISLAFSMYNNKGVYALLLGSGISRSANILTGWEIVLDLIRQLATLYNEDASGKEEEWYSEKFKSAPDYSEILEEVGKFPAERNALLKKYFEPTDEELQNGDKTPTKAHLAIAELVEKGYIKVIVTTNFDRLMERALEQFGIIPDVISNEDNLQGVTPLIHSKCTIIKVHGDYLDVRIKNTDKELSTYSKEMNKYLDRILDEFGLIITGWSGDWDIALRKVLERCKSHRFSTFWTAFNGKTSTKANDLIRQRKAEVINITSADNFYENLKEKVLALENLEQNHPLTIHTAIAQIKRYVANPENKIKIHDLVINEARKVDSKIGLVDLSGNSTKENVERITNAYFKEVELLNNLLVNGAYYSDEFEQIWVKAINVIANINKTRGTFTTGGIKYYPTLLSFYCCGIAMMAGGNYDSLVYLFNECKSFQSSEEKSVVLICMDQNFDFDHVWGKRTPVSSHLKNILRPLFNDIIPVDPDFDKYFDSFEFIYSLILIDKHGVHQHIWGQYCYSQSSIHSRGYNIIDNIIKEVEVMQNNWPLLKAGCFNGEYKRFVEAKDKMMKMISEISPFG